MNYLCCRSISFIYKLGCVYLDCIYSNMIFYKNCMLLPFDKLHSLMSDAPKTGLWYWLSSAPNAIQSSYFALWLAFGEMFICVNLLLYIVTCMCNTVNISEPHLRVLICSNIIFMNYNFPLTISFLLPNHIVTASCKAHPRTYLIDHY